MRLYTGNRLYIYEWTQLPIELDFIEQVKHFSSDEKLPLVKDKYTMFEWATGIPILYETQEEVPDIIDEDELDFEDVKVNDDDAGQEEDQDELFFNII